MLVYQIISVYFIIMIISVVYWTANIRSLNGSSYTRITTLLSIAICIYLFGYTMELNVNSISQILFWNRFEYLGIPFVSAFWLTTALIYTGHFAKHRLLLHALIYLIPLITLVLRLTNDAHHLYFASTAFILSSGKLVFTHTFGAWMYVQLIHSISMVLVAMGLFVYEFIASKDRTPAKVRLVLVASVVATAGLAMSLLKPGGYYLDYMALCLPFTCLLVIIAIVRYDFLEIKALARSKAFESNKDALLLLGRQSRIIDYNKRAKLLFSKANVTLHYGVLSSVFAPAPNLLECLDQDEACVVCLKIDGEVRYYEIITNRLDPNGYAQARIKTIRDVTEAYELNLNLQRQALIDDLSGLYNRRAFIQQGEEMLALAAAEGRSVHLLMMDLDHFKIINDEYGHLTGDHMIRYIGNTLRSTFPVDSLIARLGGEEFGVLLLGQQDDALYKRVTLFVQDIAKQEQQTATATFHMTISVGIARRTTPDQNLYNVMIMADKALYRAKDAGRNCVQRFDEI